MRRLAFISICLASFQLVAMQEDQISVTEESLPRLPSYTPRETSEVLIENLQGIVLVGNARDQLYGNALNKIEGIQFVGLKVPGKKQKLEKELSAFLHHEVTHETLVEIKGVISEYYRSSHHPLVLVQTPEQDVTPGVLQFLVLESRLGEVKVEGNEWTSSRQLLSYVKLRPNQEIDESRLLHNVSFMNRNPFRRVDVVYAPGEELGTTDVILSTKDRRPYRFYTGTENTGVEPTGRGRWYAGFNWGNVFNLDHILSYQFTSAYNMNRMWAHTVEYIAPLSWGQVIDIYGGYSQVHPKVHHPFKRNDGWSMQVSGRYVIPLKTHRYLEHEISTGGDFKRTNNTFEFTDDFATFGNNVNLTQLVLGYSGNYERDTFRLDFNGEIFWSPGRWLDDQTNADYNSLRPGAENHWVYFRGSFVYLQRLPKSFSLSLLARGQGSSEPLLPSEQFGLGGYDTVRGYDQREVNKDDAIFLSAEARTPAFQFLKAVTGQRKIKDALQFLAFIDYGWGINIDTIPGGKKSNYLLGVGPGVRYTIEPYLTARLDWGIKLHKEAEFGGGNTMVHMNVTASF